MKKIVKIIAWALIALLALGMATDWLVMLGCARGWQYIFNFASLLAMPFLLAFALPEKVFEKNDN